MNLSGNDKNKITGKKYQPVMSITGLNDQGLYIVKNLVQNFTKSANPANFRQDLYIEPILKDPTIFFKKYHP